MLVNNWITELPELSQKEKQVIQNPGSLTEYIKQNFPNFTVQVLAEHEAIPAADELEMLELDKNELAKIRTVYLCSNLKPLVFARTVVPLSVWNDTRTRLFELKDMPLGQVLFNPKDPAKRTDFQFAYLNYLYFNFSPILPALEFFKQRETLPARRSIFSWHEQGLLITELFLPDLLQSLT